MPQNKFFLNEYLDDLDSLGISKNGISLATTIFKYNGFAEALCSDKVIRQKRKGSSDRIQAGFLELISKNRFNLTNIRPRKGNLFIPIYLKEIFVQKCFLSKQIYTGILISYNENDNVVFIESTEIFGVILKVHCKWDAPLMHFAMLGLKEVLVIKAVCIGSDSYQEELVDPVILKINKRKDIV